MFDELFAEGQEAMSIEKFRRTLIKVEGLNLEKLEYFYSKINDERISISQLSLSRC